MSRGTAVSATANDSPYRTRRKGGYLGHARRTPGALGSHILLLTLLMLVVPLGAASDTHTAPTRVITTLTAPGSVHAACSGIPLPPAEPGNSVDPPGGGTPHHYQYREFQQPYRMNQIAYIFVEGGGINGSYAFDGTVIVSGNELHVSAMGQTAMQKMSSVKFFMTATLLKNGKEIMSAPLTLDEVSVWPGESTPVGSATLTLLEPTNLQGLTLRLTGGYVYFDSNGSATPAPPTTSKDFTIEVIDQ